MNLLGPDRYTLTCDAASYQLRGPDGSDKVRGRAANSGPKLYVFSTNREPVYVGVTKQPLRTRLRLGWTASGESGYHGYAFRRSLRAVDLDVWYFEPRASADPIVDIETIEAEVVFLLRSKGQWPRFQTEIHFHPSAERHRQLAIQVLGHYDVAL